MLIQKLITRIRLWRLERQIGRIFSHLNQEVDFGFDFRTDEEWDASCERLCADVRNWLDAIDRNTALMPAAYGKAFRFIAYSRIHRTLKTFLDLSRKRAPRKAREALQVA